MIDYNEFCTAFSKPSLTEETPESVMKGDYKPLQQRTSVKQSTSEML